MVAMIVSGIIGALTAAALHMLGMEAAGRGQRVVDAVIRVAAARLPEALRQDYTEEWQAEASEILCQKRGLPITRAWCAIGYCVSLLRAGARIGEAFPAEPPAPAVEAGSEQLPIRNSTFAIAEALGFDVRAIEAKIMSDSLPLAKGESPSLHVSEDRHGLKCVFEIQRPDGTCVSTTWSARRPARSASWIRLPGRKTEQ